MQIKKIFNPTGSDLLQDRKIIKGNSTNLFNMSIVKYKWCQPLIRQMTSVFWLPEKINLNQDKQDYLNLSEHEKDIFCSILSFLTVLDSLATVNIPKISEFITASEVSTCLGIQDFFEIIHSMSYAYLIDSIISQEDRMNVYEKWRTNEVLFERNRYIAQIYQNFWDLQTDDTFAEVLIANYILESIYFYNGFIFFYNMSSKNQMLGTSDIIRMINRDEVYHCDLFANIINTVNQENPNFIKPEKVKEMFAYACEEEIKWFNYILKDSNIIGMNPKSTEQYTKYLVNLRLAKLGIEPLYKGYDSNPYSSLELHADSSSDGLKTNFFESKQTNYSTSDTLSGWDDF